MPGGLRALKFLAILFLDVLGLVVVPCLFELFWDGAEKFPEETFLRSQLLRRPRPNLKGKERKVSLDFKDSLFRGPLEMGLVSKAA